MDFKLIVITGICLLAGFCQGAETPSDASSATNLPTETTPSSTSSTTTTTPPQSKTWVVVDKTADKTCILAQIISEFNFTYPVEIKANANITTGNNMIIVPLDRSTEATGFCTNTSQIITLKWKKNSVEIDFKLGKESNFSVNLSTLKSTAADLSNCSETVLTYKNDATLFKTIVDISYKCDKVQDVNMTVFTRSSSATLSISHIKFKASRKKEENISSPGLHFWPKPLDDVEESNLLRVNRSDEQNIQHWTNQMDKLLKEYRNLPKGKKVKECHYDFPSKPGQICDFDIQHLHPCTKENRYNYYRGGPCIFLKLDKIYGWKPMIYNDTSKLPDKMPQELKNHMEETKGYSPELLNHVWVTCEGENPADVENIGHINYIPKHGFPGFFFPYLNQEGYLNPIAFIHFQRPAIGVRINVVCKAWAHNIDNDRAESTGSVHFALRLDK